MCQKIDKVFQLARRTFSRKPPDKDSLDKLLKNVNELTGLDVGLDKCRTLNEQRARKSMHDDCAPVTYISIAESSEVSMGIFVIGEGETIPLHDHPYMYGIIKCIAGQLKITSYTKTSSPDISPPSKWQDSPVMSAKLTSGEVFPAELTLATLVTPETGPCLLEPSRHNIHEIKSGRGPAAFIDILAPPYNVDPSPGDTDQQVRDCQYYRDVGVASQNNNWLMMSDPPSYFYCDTEIYQGPKISSS